MCATLGRAQSSRIVFVAVVVVVVEPAAVSLLAVVGRRRLQDEWKLQRQAMDGLAKRTKERTNASMFRRMNEALQCECT